MRPVSEFQRIDIFLKAFPQAQVKVGPGDDCAVVRSQKEDLCITTDAVVENVHFTLKHFSFEDIGYKALAVNLSDLAAMGARPAWFLCAIEWPKRLPVSHLRKLARGMARLAKKENISLVGGNFTSSDKLALTLTVAGHVPQNQALLRRGARPGDFLYVSGELGDARLGLHALQQKLRVSPSVVSRQRRPIPRLRLGVVARKYARACIDISDGLAQDVAHLAKASGVGVVVHLEKLPVSPALLRSQGKHAFTFAAQGGEDYELLLAVPPGKARAFEKAAHHAGEKIARVGLCTDKGLHLRLSGEDVKIPGGFDHFL